MIIKSEKAMKKKGLFFFIVFILSFVGLIGQLTYIVMVEGKNYDLAVLQNAAKREGSVTLNDKRGEILDRNGIVLAKSISTYDLIFDAKLLVSQSEETRTATKEYLFEKLGITNSYLDEILLEKANSNYVIIGKGYSYNEIKDVKEAIDNYRLIGVFYREDYERVYPYPELASDVIGFVDSDLQGTINGIEYSYNAELSGDIGRIYGTIDEDHMLEVNEIEATDGANVELTLDYTIQKYINEAVDNYFLEEDASKIHVIVMNPNNGEIYGMADYPNYSLDDPRNVKSYVGEEAFAEMTMQEQGDFLQQLWKNENITDTYEPGSTFKPITFAMALEENKVGEHDTYLCEGGLQVADRYIKCWKPGGHGEQTIEEALENSCNVAFMKIAEAIERDSFSHFQSMFGIGTKTGIDLPGEHSSANTVFTAEKLNATELATSSFGQGQFITPIQLISAFSAVINGGYLYEPHLMSKVYTDSQIIDTNSETLVRQVISEEVSSMTRLALGGVVNEGTGAKAAIAGYEIGGKTGTAETWPRVDGQYIVSFIGFAPIENPEVVTLVVVDRPVAEVVNSRFAAKVFVDVMEDVMPYLHIFKAEEEVLDEDGNVIESDLDVELNDETEEVVEEENDAEESTDINEETSETPDEESSEESTSEGN